MAAASASTTIGVVTEATRLGMEQAAIEAGDAAALRWSVPRGGFSRLGIAGNMLGTVPAIVDDVNNGMSRPEAVISEGGGTAAGIATGTLAAAGTAALTDAAIGATMGSVVPGVGTAVGFVVGAGIGAFTSWWISKSIQNGWES